MRAWIYRDWCEGALAKIFVYRLTECKPVNQTMKRARPAQVSDVLQANLENRDIARLHLNRLTIVFRNCDLLLRAPRSQADFTSANAFYPFIRQSGINIFCGNAAFGFRFISPSGG